MKTEIQTHSRVTSFDLHLNGNSPKQKAYKFREGFTSGILIGMARKLSVVVFLSDLKKTELVSRLLMQSFYEIIVLTLYLQIGKSEEMCPMHFV